MVLGESQIGSQVREAIRRADAEGAAGPAPDRPVPRRHARRATRPPGDHARRGTRRVRRARHRPGRRRARRVARGTVGRGGRGGADGLARGETPASSRGGRRPRPQPVRSTTRASSPRRTGATAGGLDALPAALADADLVVSATGAAGHVIYARRGRAGARPAGRPAARARSTSPCPATSIPRRATSTTCGSSTSWRCGSAPTNTRPRPRAQIAAARDLVAEEIRAVGAPPPRRRARAAHPRAQRPGRRRGARRARPPRFAAERPHPRRARGRGGARPRRSPRSSCTTRSSS